MKVHQLTTSPDLPLTTPYRTTNGITLALRWGDVCHPLGSTGNWFTPPYFTKVLRFYSYCPLPFLTLKFGGFRMYIGTKVYGVDSEAYKNWLPAEVVYNGSQAIQFSIRLSTSGT